MNVIITNLSTIRPNVKEADYTSDKGSFKGTNTNDAPVKYLLTCLKEQKTPVKILAVTTQEANSAYEVFCQMVREFTENAETPAILKISTKDVEIAQTIKKIIDQIHKDDKVYIDTTGGFRNSSYLLMAVVRILEYSGISLEKAVYSNFYTHTIENVTSTYQMFNLINAAELFTSLGNSDGLQNFFEGKKSTEIKNVIKAMNHFSEEMALCRTSGLDEILEQLNTSLNELDSMTPTTENEILFQSISGVIREKFGIHEDGHKTIDYVDMIRWCLDNKQIQQAVTIYTEKIGTYLLNNYYTVSGEVWKKFSEEKSNFDVAYRVFYEGFMTIYGSSPVENFLKNAIQNPRIRPALEGCQDVPAFERRVPFLTLEKPVKEGLKNFFRVKRFIYAEDGNRRDEAVIQKKFKDYPQFAEFMNLKAKTQQGFVSQIANNNKLVALLQETQTSEFENIRFNTIESLESAISAQKDYKLLVPAEQMQSIMRDYLYIKWLRNSFNHASDEDKMTEEDKKYYSDYKYPINAILSLKEITKLLRNTLDHLQK